MNKGRQMNIFLPFSNNDKNSTICNYVNYQIHSKLKSYFKSIDLRFTFGCQGDLYCQLYISIRPRNIKILLQLLCYFTNVKFLFKVGRHKKCNYYTQLIAQKLYSQFDKTLKLSFKKNSITCEKQAVTWCCKISKFY